MLETAIVHAGADNEDGHEEEEGDLQGAGPDNCRGGMGYEGGWICSMLGRHCMID